MLHPVTFTGVVGIGGLHRGLFRREVGRQASRPDRGDRHARRGLLRLVHECGHRLGAGRVGVGLLGRGEDRTQEVLLHLREIVGLLLVDRLIERRTPDQVLVELVHVLDVLDAEEAHRATHRQPETDHQRDLLSGLRVADREGHGEAGRDQDAGVDASEQGVEETSGFRALRTA